MSAPRHSTLLQHKLRSLSSYLDELETAIPATLRQYEAESASRRVVERMVQLVIECAADAGDLLLTAEGRESGDSARDVFEALHTAGVLDSSLRRRFTYDYAGLRNRIVHDYDELDTAAVWRAARQLVGDGRALLAALIARADSGESV